MRLRLRVRDWVRVRVRVLERGLEHLEELGHEHGQVGDAARAELAHQGRAEHEAAAAHLGRCRGDVGEMQGRYRGDAGEI